MQRMQRQLQNNAAKNRKELLVLELYLYSSVRAGATAMGSPMMGSHTTITMPPKAAIMSKQYLELLRHPAKAQLVAEPE